MGWQRSQGFARNDAAQPLLWEIQIMQHQQAGSRRPEHPVILKPQVRPATALTLRFHATPLPLPLPRPPYATILTTLLPTCIPLSHKGGAIQEGGRLGKGRKVNVHQLAP